MSDARLPESGPLVSSLFSRNSTYLAPAVRLAATAALAWLRLRLRRSWRWRMRT